MDYTAQHSAAINTAGARAIARKVRFNRCPLLIAQPEFACHDPSSIVWYLESQQARQINRLIGF
jgi:hypothetical protein